IWGEFWTPIDRSSPLETRLHHSSIRRRFLASRSPSPWPTTQPPTTSGFVKWCIAPGGSGGASFSGRIHYNLTSTAICEDGGIPSGVTLGTTTLTTRTSDGVDGT
ncbi:hypothetical protein, partial [Shinella kummerowiae]|uniref:hypothetical protein n=1 Tax=Shinella kummerowiae TaxID=417745 RepID=UPI001AEE1527